MEDDELNGLIVTVSGVRGIVGDNFTPQVGVNFAQALGTYFGNGKIVIGRDSRITGEMIKNAVISGLLAVGCDVIDTGVCPTSTTQLAVSKLNARGGIAITAGDNPIEWNALRLIDSNGLFFDESQCKQILAIIDAKKYSYVSWEKIGKTETYENAIQDHLDEIFKLKYINEDLIASKKFKVVVDCVNGVGGLIVPQLLERLGCKAIFLNKQPNGLFPESANLATDNLTELCNKVKAEKADIGIALDPNADCLVIVSETGESLGEDYTLVMAVNYMTQKKDGAIVVNSSVTHAINELSKKYNNDVIRTKVGASYIARKMIETKAIIGGEGNGSIILPELNYSSDAIVGIALILQQMAEFDKKVSDLYKKLPKFYQTKQKVNLTDTALSTIIDKIIENYSSQKIDLLDGIKIMWKDEWVHIRTSNTQPCIKVISEAKTPERSKALCYQFIKQIEN